MAPADSQVVGQEPAPAVPLEDVLVVRAEIQIDHVGFHDADRGGARVAADVVLALEAERRVLLRPQVQIEVPGDLSRQLSLAVVKADQHLDAFGAAQQALVRDAEGVAGHPPVYLVRRLLGQGIGLLQLLGGLLAHRLAQLLELLGQCLVVGDERRPVLERALLLAHPGDHDVLGEGRSGVRGDGQCHEHGGCGPMQ